MRNKPVVDITISKSNNDLLEDKKINKSLLIDHLLSLYFKENNTVPQQFIRKKGDK